MINTNAFVEKYFRSLRVIVDTLPKNASIPSSLSETSFVIGYCDVRGKLGIQLLSREEEPVLVIDGKAIESKPNDEAKIICLPVAQNIEQSIFPQDSSGTSPSMTIANQHVILKGLAFSSQQYNDKYWNDANFYRNCAGDIPFSVTKDGAMLGLALFWGTELDGVRTEKLFEYIKIFGSQELLPASDKEIQNEAFRDFGHCASQIGKELDEWSFTDFVSSLEGPIEENVLLLGSYKSDDEFEHFKTILGELGYRGFLLKDSRDLPIQSNLEKLLSAIICSCFVIVLDKNASGHIAEMTAMLRDRFRPVIVVRDTAKPTTSFLEDLIGTDDNFRIVIEPNITAVSLLPHIQWAKSRLSDREGSYNKINHWRSI